MARTTVIISDDLRNAGLGASAKLDDGNAWTPMLEIRIGDEVVRIGVPQDQIHGIAAAIAADLLAALPVIGDPA
jgi:hypothetical protein